MNGMSIRAKLSLLFIGLAVVPLAGVALVSYYHSIRSVEQVVVARSESLLAEVTTDLDPLFSTLKSDVKLLARNRPVQDLYARYGREDGQAAFDDERPAIGRFFRQFIQGIQYTIARLDYVDGSGERIFSYARGTATDVTGVGMSEDEYSFVIAEPAPESGLSSLKSDAGLSVSNYFADNRSFLRLSYPVRPQANGSAAGAVIADIEVNSLLEQKIGHPALIGTGRSGAPAHGAGSGTPRIAIISHEDQTFVFYPDTSRVGRPLERVLPGLAARYEKTVRHDKGSTSYFEGDEKRLASFANHEQFGWTLVALSNPSHFTAPAERAGFINLAISFAAVLLALILVPFVVGRVTASIRRVTEGAEAIAAGDLDQEITVTTHDETRTLADAFNRMAASLKGTMGELRELTRELEDRVRRRTSALEEANRTVQEQNEKLLRESAAERLRNEVLSMSSSDDLRDVAGVFYRELNGLGIETPMCIMAFIDEERGRRDNYGAFENPRKRGLSWTSPDFKEIDDEVAVCIWDHASDLQDSGSRGEWLDKWRTRQPWTQPFVEGQEEEWEKIDEDFCERFGFETVPWDTSSRTGVTCVPFDQGVTYIHSVGWTDAQLAIVQELNEAVALGYLRFLDFQRLEAQNEALEEANEQIQEANRLKGDRRSLRGRGRPLTIAAPNGTLVPRHRRKVS
jgi:HAMP domain-containing protein